MYLNKYCSSDIDFCSFCLAHLTLSGFLLQTIREILLLGHRQAFAWMDEWHSMTIEDVREYEKDMQAKTNIKVSFLK